MHSKYLIDSNKCFQDEDPPRSQICILWAFGTHDWLYYYCISDSLWYIGVQRLPYHHIQRFDSLSEAQYSLMMIWNHLNAWTVLNDVASEDRIKQWNPTGEKCLTSSQLWFSSIKWFSSYTWELHQIESPSESKNSIGFTNKYLMSPI